MEKMGLYMQLGWSVVGLLCVAALVVVNALRGCLSGAGFLVAFAFLYLTGSMTVNAWKEVRDGRKS